MELINFIETTIYEYLTEQLILKNGYPLFYHGATDMKLSGRGIHVGTKMAATQALCAKIGVPANGEWDGTREYGKTLLAGKRTLEKLNYILGYDPIMNFNATDDVPEEDYYPKERKKRATYFSTNIVIPFNVKPVIFQVLIVGEMINSYDTPYSDAKANKLMSCNNIEKGCYYNNIWEDAGGVSAAVPNGSFLKILKV